MSWVAEAKAISQNTASVSCRKCGAGSVSATIASAAPTHELQRHDPAALGAQQVHQRAPQRLDDPGQVQPARVQRDLGVGDAEVLVHHHRQRHHHHVRQALAEVERGDPAPGAVRRGRRQGCGSWWWRRGDWRAGGLGGRGVRRLRVQVGLVHRAEQDSSCPQTRQKPGSQATTAPSCPGGSSAFARAGSHSSNPIVNQQSSIVQSLPGCPRVHLRGHIEASRRARKILPTLGALDDCRSKSHSGKHFHGSSPRLSDLPPHPIRSGTDLASPPVPCGPTGS